MGRCYHFECPRCAYRANVSGCQDRGTHCFLQTFECQSCRKLFDAVTHLRLAEQIKGRNLSNLRRVAIPGLSYDQLPAHAICSRIPVKLAPSMYRRILPGASNAAWVEIASRCPQAARHRIQPWNHPGRCPACGTFLEKTLMPVLIWE